MELINKNLNLNLIFFFFAGKPPPEPENHFWPPGNRFCMVEKKLMVTGKIVGKINGRRKTASETEIGKSFRRWCRGTGNRHGDDVAPVTVDGFLDLTRSPRVTIRMGHVSHFTQHRHVSPSGVATCQKPIHLRLLHVYPTRANGECTTRATFPKFSNYGTTTIRL